MTFLSPWWPIVRHLFLQQELLQQNSSWDAELKPLFPSCRLHWIQMAGLRTSEKTRRAWKEILKASLWQKIFGTRRPSSKKNRQIKTMEWWRHNHKRELPNTIVWGWDRSWITLSDVKAKSLHFLICLIVAIFLDWVWKVIHVNSFVIVLVCNADM